MSDYRERFHAAQISGTQIAMTPLEVSMPARRIRLLLISAILSMLAALPALAATPSLVLSKTSVTEGEKIAITVANGESPSHKLDWIGLYEEGVTPSGHPPSIWYVYLVDVGITGGNGVLTFDPATIEGGAKARYGSGKYKFIFAYDDGYHLEASAGFTVTADQGAFTGASPFYLISVESGKAMNLSGAESADYTPIILWDYVGSANEEWRLLASDKKDWFYILSRLNYRMVAVEAGSERVVLLAKGAGDNFLWRMERVGTDAVKFASKLNGKYLDTENSGKENSVQLRLGKGQAWTVKTNAMGEGAASRALVDESTRLYAEGKIKDAAVALEGVVGTLERQHAPKPAALSLVLADCYARLEDLYDESSAFDKVLALHKRATARFPELVGDADFVALAAEAAFWLGSIALGKGDYVEARRSYDAADSLRMTNPRLAKEDDWQNITFIRNITTKRYALRDVKPEAVQNILVLYYNDDAFTVTESGGATRTVSNHLRQKDRDRSEIIQGVAARVVEAWSGGKLSLSFRRVPVPGVLQGFFTWSDSGSDFRYCEPDLYRVSDEAAQNKIMLDNLGWADSLMIYWDKRGLYEDNFGFGGATTSYPVIPYQVKIPWRGFVEMPSRLSGAGSFKFLLHEYFHTVEDAWSIWPRHGFTDGNRASFPDWKGDDQLDYYRWHFAVTIPARIAAMVKDGDNSGWARSCFALRSPFVMGADQLDRNRVAIAKLSLDDRASAYDLFKQAEELRNKGDAAQAQKLYSQVAKLNPSFPELHRVYGDLAADRKDYEGAAREYRSYLDLVPSPDIAWSLAGIYDGKLDRPADADAWYQRYADYAIAAGSKAEARGYHEAAGLAYADCVGKLIAMGRNALATKVADKGLGGMGGYVARFGKAVPATMKLSTATIAKDGKIVVSISDGNDPTRKSDWVGLYEADVLPDGHPPSIWYVYLQDVGIPSGKGSLTFDPATISDDKRERWHAGAYKFIFAFDDGYHIEASAAFRVK